MTIENSIKNPVGILFLAVVAVFLGGCQSIGDIKKSDDLDRALKAYEAAMRWNDPVAMLSYHKFADGEPVPLPEDYEDLRVMEYNIIYPPVKSSPTNAQQMVEISYANINNQVVHKVKDRQTWVYDKEIKVWRVTSPIPLPNPFLPAAGR
jgi:hypothetical protein